MNQTNEKDVAIYKRFQKSPLYFIELMWGLKPERDNSKFIKGKHITHHQEDILLAIESALRKEKPTRIAIRAGRGIGKTATLSWIILWYLFCYKDAQIACTAPTAEQMNDALWKELSLWLGKMPKEIQALYEWDSSHLRIKERRNTWFARARTARKENPEALAGIHGEYVMLIADEASGVDDNIFKIAEGALTGGNFFFITVSNPRRLIGYYYDSFKSGSWQHLNFDSRESPVVKEGFINEMREKYSEDSDEFRVEVMGEFPKADAVDDKGYLPLFLEDDLHFVPDQPFTGSRYMGVDPSGAGDDLTAWVGRDNFIAKILGEEKISNEKTIAKKTVHLMINEGFEPENTTIDDFGVGSKVAREIYMSDEMELPKVNPINVGEPADEKELYINKRAEMYFRAKNWLRSGGSLVKDDRWKELLTIRYRREINGRLKIMSKEDMRKQGIRSPNFSDAFAETFLGNEEFDMHESVTSVPVGNYWRR